MALSYPARGVFGSRHAEPTAEALRLYSLGLLYFAAVKVVVPVFYSLKLSRVAVLSTVTTVLLGVLCNLLLHPLYGYRALAFSTSLERRGTFCETCSWCSGAGMGGSSGQRWGLRCSRWWRRRLWG